MARFKKASDVRVGVVGYGGAFNMGQSHLNQMKQAGMTPLAVAEIDPKRLAVAQKDFPGIETYSSVGRMLKQSEVNLVTVITPHSTHAPLALQCLRAGRHVVCEKPFAVSTAECDRMIAEAKKRRLMLSTYHNRHWDGCIMQALKQIRSGRIGQIVRIEAHMGGYHKPGPTWRSSRSLSGGILFDWGVHLLEYAFQVIDAPMVEVAGFAADGHWAAKTAWKGDTIEDEGFAVVRFANGPWLTLCITHVDSKPKEGQMEITGTKGTYVFQFRKWRMIRQVAGKVQETEGENPPSEGCRYYRNVAEHLTKGAPLVITPQWARRPIHVLDLARRSAKLGRAMKVKYE